MAHYKDQTLDLPLIFITLATLFYFTLTRKLLSEVKPLLPKYNLYKSNFVCYRCIKMRVNAYLFYSGVVGLILGATSRVARVISKKESRVTGVA